MQNLISTIKHNSMLQNLNLTTVFFAFLVTVLLVFKVLGLANVGVDLTDEGYYFNWISNPWLYKYYASQFGYIYHPIYRAMGDSIAHLRQANMLISFGLSWVLSYFVLRTYFTNLSKPLALITSASIALPSLYILMITGHWIPSPSYNSLNFQGCILATLGFLVSEKSKRKEQYYSMLLIGLGGWLIFMAKASTALLLAIVAIFYYLPSIKRDWRIIVGAGIVSVVLLILSALLIDGSIIQFYKRYAGGMQLMATMNSGHGIGNILKLDFFSLSPAFKAKLLVLSLILFFCFRIMSSRSSKLEFLVTLLLTLTITMSFYWLINPSNEVAKIPRYHTLILIALLLSSATYYFINRTIQGENIPVRLVVLLLALPYIFAVGTSNNYWQTGAGASVFWCLASVLIIGKRTTSIKTLSVIVCFIVSIGVINILDSIKTPYRQTDSILQQTANYVDPHTQQTLVLSKDTAKYLNELKILLSQTNFQANTPVIDLTGHHPGTLYFMQAKSIGQAWTIGGYSGTIPLAILALNQASCEEIANAWLLIEKDGRRALTEHILSKHGIVPSKDNYKTIGKLETQPLRDWGSINSSHPDGVYIHYLVKPTDVNTQTKACEEYRKTHPSPFEQL